MAKLQSESSFQLYPADKEKALVDLIGQVTNVINAYYFLPLLLSFFLYFFLSFSLFLSLSLPFSPFLSFFLS